MTWTKKLSKYKKGRSQKYLNKKEKSISGNVETEFLQNFRNESCIISTGGGVAMNEENVQIMRDTGLVLYLDATFHDIWMRIKNDLNRPIVQNSTKGELEQLYKHRKRFYKKAKHITIFTENRTLKQITEYAGYQVNRLKGE